MSRRFTDRAEAGRELAGELKHLAGKDTIVLALPRGGVVVGYEIAHELGVPLDVLTVPKREFGVLAANLPDLRRSFEAKSQERARPASASDPASAPATGSASPSIPDAAPAAASTAHAPERTIGS